MHDKQIRKIRAALLVLPLAFWAGQAMAANYVVDTASDSGTLTACTASAGDCSLRGAITNANNAGGSSTISFDDDYTITLGSQLPIVTGDIAIAGNGEAYTVVQASTCNPITLPGNCTPANWRVLQIAANGSLTLSGVTVRNGDTSGNGGGIDNQGTLTITDSSITGNVSDGGTGGGIHEDHHGNVTLTRVVISGNAAVGGGGLQVSTASVDMNDVTLDGNSVGITGGGINIYQGVNVALNGVTFSNNVAHGSGFSEGGGGMSIISTATATLANVTFNGNSASTGTGGGILINNSSPDLINVTFSGNTAKAGQGGGLSNFSGSTPSLINVVIADSTGGDCVNSVSSLNSISSHNVIQNTGVSACGLTNGSNGNQIGVNPLLHALANNGGFTQTMALKSGSPAIDMGDNGACPATDQRGIARPQRGICDIGAYEFVGATIGYPIVNSAADTDDGSCDSLGQGSGNQDCTLREAINAANAYGAPTSITFAADYTITLDGRQLPAITSGITITGNGVDHTIVQASTCDPVTLPGGCTPASWRVFQVKSTGALSLNGVRVQYGNRAAGSGGGGVYNQGTLTLTDTQISANATMDVGGAGLLNAGDASLTRVTISGNACPVCGGGGMFSNGIANLTDVRIDGNSAARAGGLLHASGALSLDRVTFNANQATGSAGNDVGGGMANNAAASLSNVTFSGNSTAASGGGLFTNASQTVLTNVTFSGNAAAAGQGGGLFNGASDLTLVNVIIANSANGGDCVNDSGAGLDAASSNNLVEDRTSTCGMSNGIDGNIIGDGDPLLGALADNGGYTQTFALLSGSPAINTGTNTGCPAVDQRGVTRPQGARCDIGAYEVQDTTPPSLQSFSRQNPAAATTNADTLTFRATFSEAVQNVDASDFAVNGSTTASVSGVNAVDTSTYDITVSGGDLVGFNGSVGLNLAASQNIVDDFGNALPVGEPSTDETYTLDNTPPAAPSVPDLTAATDTGISNTDNITYTKTPTFEGTAEPGTTVTVSSDVDGVVGSTVASGGNWSISVSSPMSEGVHAITATATDAAGNVSSASVALNVTIDTTPPLAVITSVYAGTVNAPFQATVDFGEPVTGFTLSDITHTKAQVGNLAGSGATYTVTVTPTGADPSTIKLYVRSVVVQDTAGNANVPGPTFSIDYDTSIAGPLCYVNQIATGGNSGAPWANAYADLQSALTNTRCGEVWVAMGIYKPTSGTDRSISFNILPGVAVYGGFAGTETSRSTRDPVANITVLSGDIGGVDNDSDNSFQIVAMDGSLGTPITASTVLDGFTVTGGNANGSDTGSFGGGMYCNGENNGNECSPTVSNATFSGNSASLYGGAMLNNGNNGGTSSPILSNVTFSSNSAPYGGGAMFNAGANGTSSPALSNVTFSNNSTSDAGGAMLNNGISGGLSSPTLSNVTFTGNSATNGSGGAMFNVGEDGGLSSPILSNITFNGNSAGKGGAMYNYGGTGTSNPTLSNVILWGDTATASGPEIYNVASSGTATPSIDHSVVQGSGGSGSWDASLGTDGGGNLDADPLLGALANHGGSTDTLLIGAGSSAIDTGNDTTCGDPDTVNSRDQRRVTRPQGPHCDIGAVEFVDTIFYDDFELVP